MNIPIKRTVVSAEIKTEVGVAHAPSKKSLAISITEFPVVQLCTSLTNLDMK